MKSVRRESSLGNIYHNTVRGASHTVDGVNMSYVEKYCDVSLLFMPGTVHEACGLLPSRFQVVVLVGEKLKLELREVVFTARALRPTWRRNVKRHQHHIENQRRQSPVEQRRRRGRE
ncbi:hypothetical protein M409DRAFT_60397 [Zasmidium cellare ATCC 36951]|uniref:Uncharacterized protein n=1 Tax=Zasmidium cellare ATCC 36951 TaxID=1080233 RepID=A0A6A6C3M8_ZASCE|nr:uncharacterized protein M409DRAFT_60397 [Zasmidium cellare ATCC 36951]KAF2159996.1 hypothetical protein M409DRAFT_60397 [Zasmidium cellare ATCC 36951]